MTETEKEEAKMLSDATAGAREQFNNFTHRSMLANVLHEIALLDNCEQRIYCR